MSKIIRISQNAYDLLYKLEAQTGFSKQTLIEQALERFAVKTSIAKPSRITGLLQSNPKAWNDELEERAEWETFTHAL